MWHKFWRKYAGKSQTSVLTHIFVFPFNQMKNEKEKEESIENFMKEKISHTQTSLNMFKLLKIIHLHFILFILLMSLYISCIIMNYKCLCIVEQSLQPQTPLPLHSFVITIANHSDTLDND